MNFIAPADGDHVAIVTKEQNELDSLNRFLRIIGKQDERAMVLSLAAFIEDTLGRLLSAYLRDCKATQDLVEGFNAPLGTLSSRIKAAFAFGLVNEEQFRDMEILRRIRNHFAHNWEGISLERNDIASMIGQLSGYTFSGRNAGIAGKSVYWERSQAAASNSIYFTDELRRGNILKHLM